MVVCTQDLGTTDGKLKRALEDQDKLQQQVDGYAQELSQRMERIRLLETTRNELLEQESRLHIQLQQYRKDLKKGAKEQEQLAQHVASLRARNAELQSQNNQLQSEAMVCYITGHMDMISRLHLLTGSAPHLRTTSCCGPAHTPPSGSTTAWSLSYMRKKWFCI